MMVLTLILAASIDSIIVAIGYALYSTEAKRRSHVS
jgi:hypothetical protein